MTERLQKKPEQTASPQGGSMPPEQEPHLTIEQPGSRADRAGTRIEVFTGAVRMTGPTFRLEVKGADFSYKASGDRTVFTGTGPDQEQLLFGVRSDGAVLFRADPRAAEAPQTPEQTPESPAEAPHSAAESPSETIPSPAAHLPAAADGPSDAESPTAKTEEEKRVQLTGRLGRNPSFRTAQKGGLVGKFPLAVHHENGQTSWHTVLAFGERAQQLKNRVESGELVLGREVDVVGYLHENERPGKNGTRTVQEVYAVAVKKR